MFDSLRNNSKIVVYIVVAAFVVTGTLMGFGSYMSNNSSPNIGNTSSSFIAVVNGAGITPQQYMDVLRNQAPQTQLSQSQVIPFRFNVLNSMIERQLILEQAEKMGIEAQVTDEDVENIVNEIMENNDMNKEELNSRLEEQNSSLKQFNKDIKESLKTNDMIQQTIETTYNKVQVTEEEIQEAYEESNNEKEFDELREQLEESILSEKQNKAFDNWLKNIKAGSEITINDPELNAYYQLQNKNYDQAIELFDNIIEFNSGPMMYNYLAQAYKGKENQEKVISTYKKALEEYPDNWELYYNFGDYYHELDKKEEALVQYDKAASKAGEDIMAYYKLYIAYMILEAEDRAEKAMETMTELQKKMQEQQERLWQSEDEKTLDSIDDTIDNKGDRDEN